MTEHVVTVTEFQYNTENKQWSWHTLAANGEIVGDSGESYHNLIDAVNGFFAQQGYDPAEQYDPAERHYSKLYQAADNLYHICKYDGAAPQPFEAI